MKLPQVILLAEASLNSAELLGGRDLCWGLMIYGCQGRNKGDGYDLPPCGHEQPYFLGMGVEGPKAWRKAIDESIRDVSSENWDTEEGIREMLHISGGMLYTPSAFFAGSCPSCYGGSMAHVRFADDQEFEDLRLAPTGSRYFRVPDIPSALAQVFIHGSHMPQAELVVAS